MAPLEQRPLVSTERNEQVHFPIDSLLSWRLTPRSEGSRPHFLSMITPFPLKTDIFFPIPHDSSLTGQPLRYIPGFPGLCGNPVPHLYLLKGTPQGNWKPPFFPIRTTFALTWNNTLQLLHSCHCGGLREASRCYCFIYIQYIKKRKTLFLFYSAPIVPQTSGH